MASARQARTWNTGPRKSPLRVASEIPEIAAGSAQGFEPQRVLPDSAPAFATYSPMTVACRGRRAG